MRPILLVVLLSGCSLLTDHSSVQCTRDEDCARYGQHPYCKQGVCVASGLGPEGCFRAPVKQRRRPSASHRNQLVI